MSISLVPRARLPCLFYCWLIFASFLLFEKSSTCILDALLYTLLISFCVLHLLTFTGYTSLMFSSVAQLCPTLWDPMDGSMPGLPVHHQLLEFTQTHVHWVGDPFQPSHPLLSPSPPTFNLSQHQGILKWVNSSHQVAKVLEFQLQHQSFQWIFKIDFL